MRAKLFVELMEKELTSLGKLLEILKKNKYHQIAHRFREVYRWPNIAKLQITTPVATVEPETLPSPEPKEITRWKWDLREWYRKWFSLLDLVANDPSTAVPITQLWTNLTLEDRQSQENQDYQK